jgi:co-chaperonin GroES (HSP10)
VTESLKSPASLVDIDAFEAAKRAADMATYFPEIDPGIAPCGSRIVVQIRTSPTRTKGGIITAFETREIDKWNQQIGIVRAVGKLAFCNRDTGKQWTEGAWCKVGDFIRAIKWGGDRWEAQIPGRPADETAMFLICNDLDVIGTVTGDPLRATMTNLNL